MCVTMSHQVGVLVGGDQSLDAILPLRHAATAAALAAPAVSATAAPITLIEDTLACSADFLLIHAISTFLRCGAQSDSSSASAASAAAAGTVSDRRPAVALCTFKQSSAHYTHIARKWGVALPSLERDGSLYLLDDLHSPAAASAAASTAALSAAQLDDWFQTAADESTQPTSPLHAFVERLIELRRRHSSLLVVVDDLQWLFLHSGDGGDISVLDAIAALQQAIAEEDRKDETHNRPTTSLHGSNASPSSSFASLPSPSPAASLPSGLVVVSHGDLAATPVVSLLRRRSSTFIRLSALQTGYAHEISGVMSVQQQDLSSAHWTALQRWHYKLADSHVRISAPGHSSGST